MVGTSNVKSHCCFKIKPREGDGQVEFNSHTVDGAGSLALRASLAVSLGELERMPTEFSSHVMNIENSN